MILDATGKELMRKGVTLEASTNNKAEYVALIEGLFAVLNFKIQKLIIKSVSFGSKASFGKLANKESQIEGLFDED